MGKIVAMNQRIAEAFRRRTMPVIPILEPFSFLSDNISGNEQAYAFAGKKMKKL